MKLFRWQEGRQKTGYRKMLLAHGKTWDLYLLDYPPGSNIWYHLDPVEHGRHWRANLRLCGAPAFYCDVQPEVWLGKQRLIIFRPDINWHGVAKCPTRRMVLSFGINTL